MQDKAVLLLEDGTLFEGYLIPWAEILVRPIPSALIRDMIVDPDFGILPTGIFLALGLVLPVLFCFYIAFGILEDSGYLPRISILLDRVFQKMGSTREHYRKRPIRQEPFCQDYQQKIQYRA